jgi:hypothetical protein
MGTQAVATETVSGQQMDFLTPYLRYVARIRRDPGGIAMDAQYDGGPVFRHTAYQAGDILGSPPLDNWGAGVVRVGMYSVDVSGISGAWIRGFRIVRGLQSFEVAAQGFYDAVAAATAEFVHLVELEFSTGTVRLTTGAQDVDWAGETWQAVGGALDIGGVEETGDGKGQGVDVRLSGVDQSILAVLLSAQYRGRPVHIYRAHWSSVSGQLIGDPILLHRGLQLAPYTVEEQQDRDGGTVTISTRLSGPLALSRLRGVMTSLVGHQHFYPGDTFFRHSASLANEKVYWGTAVPATHTGGLDGVRAPPAMGSF